MGNLDESHFLGKPNAGCLIRERACPEAKLSKKPKKKHKFIKRGILKDNVNSERETIKDINLAWNY